MDDLKLIKKYYGEAMMHLCRQLFPTLLEKEGLMFSLLDNHFAHNKMLYDDIVNNRFEQRFKTYINSLLENNEKLVETNKSTKELLSDAGYTLYECKNEFDIQKFRKYYAFNEALCTFKGGRLKSCYVFFAVKKNVDNIKRQDYLHPSREDEYGTSVISIQFSKGAVNTLSIKNRYNHTVENPDATFGNNLDNIILGLTYAFKNDYKLNINYSKEDSYIFSIMQYTLANDGKWYRYSFERNGTYYCYNNLLLEHGKIIDTYKDKSRYVFLDDSVLDLRENKIFRPAGTDYWYYEFGFDINNVTKITTNKDGHNRVINFHFDDEKVVIKVNGAGEIIYYENNIMEEIPSFFLQYNKALKTLIAKNARKIGVYVLEQNYSLKNIDIRNVEYIGHSFLRHNHKLEVLDVPKLKEIDALSLQYNTNLRKLNAPSLKEFDFYVLERNDSLYDFNMPHIGKLDESNFRYSKVIRKLIYLKHLRYKMLETMKEKLSYIKIKKL